MTDLDFLGVLGAAVHSQVGPEPDWETVFPTAKRQNLFPLVYDAASAYSNFAAFDEAHPEYFAAATAAMTAQMGRTEAFLALYRAFQAEGLAPITMKGIICRSLYGQKADFRPSGDEDLLIEKKDFARTAAVLESCGYQKKDDPDQNMEVIQEVTFQGEELEIELHLNPFGADTAVRERMNDWFRNVFTSQEFVEIQGTMVRTMAPTDHFLFLVFHAFKHFTAGGCGVRLMLDILLFAEKYGERIDWSYVHTGVTDVGAAGFLADLLEIGNRFLGFHLPMRGEPVCPEELLEDMLRVGTFGNTTSTECTAGRLISDAVQKGGNGKLRSYFRLLFPSWKTWCAWRPYLKDRPWMVIPEWIWRIGRFLRGETNIQSLRGLEESYTVASTRMQLLEKYHVL